MTTEEKARAYDEALKRAKEWMDEWEQIIYPREIVENVFPELAESDDEKIRKSIESVIHVYGKTQGEWIGGYDMDTLVVHLREAFSSLEKQKEQKPINESNMHEPTLDEARKWNEAYEKGYSLGYENGRKEQKPVEWSEKHIADIFEKAGLAKIAREQGNDALTNAVQSAMIELSKVKNAEWNEEDAAILSWCISDIERAKYCKSQTKPELCDIEINWLKSLCPSWKPNNEQMKALHAASSVSSLGECVQNHLWSLYNDLQKLM